MNENGTFWMPPQNSSVAADMDTLFYFIYWWSVFFFIGVVGLTIYFYIKYRRKGEVTFTPDTSHNKKLEVLYVVFPTILVFIVFIWGFRDFMKIYVPPKDAIEIKVTGQQWLWSFDYQQGTTTINELVVPVNKKIKLLMSSKDVIHSFWVPSLRVKFDVLPNRYSRLWFEALRTGEFPIKCTEYCGKDHSLMLATMKIVSSEEYEKWLESSDTAGEGMAPAEYGAMLYTKYGCNACHTTDGTANQGPSWKGIFGKQEQMEGGGSVLVDENYIRESILTPQAKITKGFQGIMPPYQGLMKDKEIDAIVAFIKSLE